MNIKELQHAAMRNVLAGKPHGIQYRALADTWEDAGTAPDGMPKLRWDEADDSYRRKPATITHTINGRTFELPLPMRVDPELRKQFWIINGFGEVEEDACHKVHCETEAINRGRLHHTEADAQAWLEFETFARGGVL